MHRIILFLILIPTLSFGANFTLEVFLPEASDNTNNRYYKAYPGLAYEVPVGVFGGTYPFTYSLTTYPTGMTIDSDTGVITWPNPTTSGSPHSVTVSIDDADSTTVTRSWTITVTTTGFIFVDIINGTHSSYNGCSSDCGTGTLTNPFYDLYDVYYGDDSDGVDTNQNTLYNDYFLYFREGTYYPQGVVNSSGQKNTHIDWRVSKPIIWMAYPGETVVIDHDHASADESGAAFWMDNATSTDYDDLWIQGITFKDMLNNAVLFLGEHYNVVIYDNVFSNIAEGQDGMNSGYLEYRGDGAPSGNSFHLISHNDFQTGVAEITSIKLYNTQKVVIETNTFDNVNIAPKEWPLYIDIRNNTMDNHSAGTIGGNWNEAANMEIRYNNIKNSAPSGVGGQNGALVINYHDTAGEVFIHRNTFEGAVTLWQGTSDDGPFHFDNNVVVNENASIDDPDGSYIVQGTVGDDSCLQIGSGADSNLVGAGADSIIDANGELTASYSAYVGSKGHQLSSGGSTTGYGQTGNTTHNQTGTLQFTQ